jgi:KUP system potassium uptake protein
MVTAGEQAHTDHAQPFRSLVLGALGVAYGDIGTSPLYALRECFSGEDGLILGRGTILGILSLIVWALILIVTLKYILIVLRADNRGEGGVLALMTVAARRLQEAGKTRHYAILLGLLGAALFYGDGIITPAISVLGAVEGLTVTLPALHYLVVPLSIGILVGLFVVQRRGTALVGALFGPVMLIWFTVLALLGIYQLVQTPEVLEAINPIHAVALFADHGFFAFMALGGVVLAVTGAEALYADMGHFGRRPIQTAWLALVLPALLLNYLGQGALLLRSPQSLESPFYLMAPEWALFPLLLLATAATVIASQAVISGVFSITRQAIQLGYLPRLDIRHTSEQARGQIYVPAANWALMVAVLAAVLIFESSSALAGAYGIAATGEMILTTILGTIALATARVVAPVLLAAGVTLFMIIDLGLFGATSMKIANGGWLPLGVAVLTFSCFSIWKKGRTILAQQISESALPVRLFTQRLIEKPITRVSGTAVFMTSNPEATPQALLHNLKHNQVLHERVVLMNIQLTDYPHIGPDERALVENLGNNFYRIVARYGFMERPDVPDLLSRCDLLGLPFRMMETSFFLSRETLVPSQKTLLNPVQERIFIGMSHINLSATAFFNIPPGRVVELGTQIEI